MKVLIVGASGMIGSEALSQCLAHPDISSVIAFGRRELPTDVSNHPKLKFSLVKDFTVWPDNVLQQHADAAGIIWAMGTYDGSQTIDLEYPVAFMEAMIQVLESNPNRPPFRYVLLSGKFVRQNQEQKLWFFEKPRKIKGVLETKALAFEKDHAQKWETYIVKPGGVVSNNSGGVLGTATRLGAVMGENWSVKVEELGAFMVYLVTEPKGEDSISENGRIVRKGRELLKLQQETTKS